MRAVLAPPPAIRWLIALPVAMLIAISLTTLANPTPAQAVAAQLPPPECTVVPEFVFHTACVEHDYCYSPSSFLSRRECDNNFRADMYGTCDLLYGYGTPANGGCRITAEGYYWGVRVLGEDNYDGRGGDGYGGGGDDGGGGGGGGGGGEEPPPTCRDCDR